MAPNDVSNEISIIGMGMRLPGGVTTKEAFWDLLCQPEPAIRQVPEGRGWTAAEYVCKEGKVGCTVTDRAGWVDDVDRFDPAAFKISPKEAAEMDPQQRLTLECSYEALLDAYVNPTSLAGTNTGVFVGAGIAEYMAMAFSDPNNMTMHTMSGNSLAVIANRVSNIWDLRGPSLTTDTACSSAMTALHLGVQALKTGDCDLAIVVGVNSLLGPSPFIGFTQAQMLSPTGTSRPFDQNANGFVRGEGCGVLILKRTADIVASDPGRIYAYVRGSGINEDGKTKSLTMPSEEAQHDLMADVIRKSGTTPEDIVFVEAHGTGTKVGDPIEARSIVRSTLGSRSQVAVGSAKGHVGHLETAAGIVGVLKATLILYNNQIPPTAGFTKLSDNIENTIRIPSSVEELPMPASGNAPCTSINSYGFGGSNGYAILAQAPKAESKAASPQPTVLALSSHFADGVEKSEKTWKALTVAPEGVAIGAAVSTACRPPQRYRKVLIAEPGAPLTKAQSVAGERVGASPAVLFAFGGQGSQYAEMGRALYDQFPVFRRTIDELCAEYKQLSTIDLQKEHGFCQRDIPEESLGSVMVSVPSTVFVQCALVELLTDAGISAAAAVGHSTGEIVAAYTAGCIDKTALVKVTHARAAAQCAMKEGAMAAWAAPAKDAEAVVAQLGLQDKVCVSCINTATGVTLSGEKEAVEKLIAHGKSLNPPVRCTVLPITRAYHSPHVDEVRAKFLQLAEGVVSQAPHKCPLLSATFGKQQGTATDPEYFFENMRRPVLFEKACVAVASLAAAGVEPKVVLEVSPHAVLMPYLSENLNEMKYVPCLNKKRPGATHMLMALGTLFTSGVEVDWAKALSPAIEQASGDLKIPSLVWQHKDPIRSVTWVLPYSHNQKGAPALLQVPKPQEGRQRALSDAAAREAAEGSNQLLITPEKQEYLRDHIVDGECVLPGAFYVCAAVQRGHMLQNAGFHRYLSLHDKFMKEDAKGGVPLNIVADGPRMALCSNGDPETNEHFSCFLPRFPPAQPELMFKGKVAELKAKFAEQARVGGGDVNLNSAYTSLETFSGLKFGPAFRRMTSLRVARDGCEALASITPPDVDSRRDDAARVMHPSVLDGAFQALAFLHGLDSDMFVPNAIKQMFIVHPCSGAPEVLAHAALKHVSRDVVIGDIDIYDANSGEVAVIIRGLTLRRAPSGKSKAPRLYATKLQTLGLQTAPTPCPEAFDDLLTLVRNTLSTGRVVRILGLPGSNGVMEKLAKELSLSGPKESAVCPLRNSQLVLVTMDETMTGQAVHRVVDAGAVVAGSWDVLVCGNDADLHGDTRTPVAQRFLNDGGILCGATCWVRFEKKEAVDTSALKVEVLGSDAFGSGVARADAEYVIDCRADVGAASALMKDIMAAKQSPTVVCLVPYDEAQTGGVLAVKDRALALRGWCRCARNETGLDVLSLQVPFPVTAETAGKVLELLGRKAPDQELKLSADGKWEVPRILPVIGGASVATETEDVRLQVGRPGQLSSLHWHPLQADFEDVREDEVQVQVSAVSMHFKDVMLAMGMLGDFKPIIGMECAGTVTRVGSGVKNFKIGDQVMCLAMSTSVGEERSALFGTKCISKERQTVLMPKRDDLSFVEAAGFLGVMATAWHALVKVAQLSKEDTVLIHSTLGGVGQAALQIALNTGCRIIGSAGNAEKRSALLDMGCHMVMDSRNPSEFVSKVMEFTEGRGVDVVLNSLAGDGQAETLKCVAPCGRFVEIGKRDILMDKRMGLGALKENVTFFSVHLDLLDQTHPHKVRALIDECTEMLANGKLKPTPTQVFPADQVVDAFKLMASGKHQGKIVVEIPKNFKPSTVDAQTGQPRLPQTLFPANGSVLVTGGTRGLGLEVGRWAADKGARHLILLTSSGDIPAKSTLVMEAIKATHPGITIDCVTCDVRDAAQVKKVFAEASPSITSVFHAANQYSAEDCTTLTDANLMGPTWDIKVQGAANIQKAAAETNSQISAMIMFTSLAGIHGNKGQSLYVAANAAMQKLAEEMRTTKSAIPAIALDFPIVVGAGRLADFRNTAELQLNTGRGFGVISFSRLEGLLERIMASPWAYPPHMTMDTPHSDSPQAWAGYHQLNKNLMLFEHLTPSLGVAEEDDDEEAEGGGGGAAGAGQSPEEIQQAVLEKIAFVLGAGTDDLEMDVPLPEMGVDSLAAVELANWGQSQYGATVSQTEFLSGLTPKGFLDRVLESAAASGAPKAAPKAKKPKADKPAAPTPAAPTPAPAAAPAAPKPAIVDDVPVQTYSRPAAASYEPVAAGSAAAMPVASSTGGQFGERTISLTETLNPKTLREIVQSVKGERRAPAQVLVFKGSNSPHFCTGMDLKAATFGDDQMSEGLEEFAKLHQALEDATMPTIAVCHGATRGGGMLFPCHATIVLAITGATFGFPEIRQGGLPGVVSVAAKKRLNPTTCKRWMCTGDAYSAEAAMQAGLVDFVGTPEEVDRELRRLLSRFRSMDSELLEKCYTKCPAGNVDQALLAMGSLDKRDRVREREPDALVNLSLDPETGVCVLELNDPTHCNAIDWAMADDLMRAIKKLKEMRDEVDANGAQKVRAIVFQGAGDHFCVGVNPYNFIRRTKQLPVITSGQITYEIYRAFVALRDIGCPVVAVVHGKAMGGGLAACLNADYRIAHEGTLFNYGNLPRGVCPGLLLSHNLGMTVGHKNATDLYMNDITATAHEAQGMGLVNEVYSTVELAKAKGFEFAARLASFPVTGVKNTLSLMRPPIDEQRLARECMGIARCNKVGNAFSGAWKAAERRTGEEGSRFGSGAQQPKQAIAAKPVQAPAQPLVTITAPKHTEPNYNAWPNHQEYLDAVTKDVPTMAACNLKAAPQGPSRVFLTGASGFLGAFIIRDLLAEGHTVSCLVRADDKKAAMGRLQQNMKDYGIWSPDYAASLKVYCGDLESKNFGLKADEWAEAARENCVFIHNGADVNFSCAVEELLPTNVEGTKTALRMAAEGGMRFCHVSSLSVFSLYHFVGEASTKRPDPRILINGYARSKWLAEQCVWVAGERGMEVTVVRPGRIMGDSQTGAANLKDWFARYLLTCVQMQRAWNVDHQTDMTQVDGVSALIVQSALSKFVSGGCYHAVSLENLHTIDITSYLVSQGYKMDPVDYGWWMDRVKSLATSAMQPLLNTFAALPVKETDGQVMRFSSDMPHRNGSGLAQLERMVRWMREKGFLPGPQHPAGSLPLPRGTKASADSAPTPAPVSMPKMQPIKVAETTPAPQTVQAAVSSSGARNAGIHAIEIYTPNHCVDQSAMEQHHGCPGKYTAGLLQEQIGFCGDDEDSVSMALTVVTKLLKRTGIPLDRIGRLEVGTESLLDRSKSIKTHLMSIFQEAGCYDIEGVDNYNACYGGTAAFLNSMGWLQSEGWDGRLALVVCVDIADFADHQAFLNGASAVALLLGPDAPVVLMKERASCMINSWDFYKPVGWKDAYPLMPDGKHSVDCYMACLDMCYNKLSTKVAANGGNGNLVEDNDYFVNHCTSTYLCKRAFKRVCENAYPKSDEKVESIFGCTGPAGGMTIKLKEQQTLYETKAEPATWITKRVGSSYTASCYTNMYSLFATIAEGMIGKTVVVYSYGSGSAATMYRLRIDNLPTFDRDVFKRLDARVKHEPDNYVKMIEAYTASTYGRTDFKPTEWGGKQDGVYYLSEVDELGKRSYKVHAA